MTSIRRFDFRATARDGTQQRGLISADSRSAAAAAIAERGLMVLDVRAHEPNERWSNRVSQEDGAMGLRVLASLLASGLSVSRALHTLGEVAPTSWRRGIETLREAVREGKSLSSALAAGPLDLPPVAIGIIRAGEGGSGLAESVHRAAEMLESAASTRTALKGALTYPLVLATVGVMTTAILVGVVLPRFATLLEQLGQTLPTSTALVLRVADIVRAFAVPGLLTITVAVVAWYRWTARDAGRRTWHNWLLSLPVVGRIRATFATARTTAALAALYESGVAMSAALTHASRASGDSAIGARILRARDLVATGQTLSRALENTKATTPVAIRLVAAGEQSGQLATMLAHAARLEEERAQRQVRIAVRLLEPSLILVFGGLVALVASALLQAVYSVRPAL